MTVREAFEKAYGPMPEGATCHIGADCCNRGWSGGATIVNVDGIRGWCGSRWGHAGGHYPEPYGPDISDRLAEAFLGFFGGEYDRVVEEAEGE